MDRGGTTSPRRSATIDTPAAARQRHTRTTATQSRADTGERSCEGEPVARERQGANALAGRGEDGVRDGGRNADRTDLAETSELVGRAVAEVNVDARRHLE